MLLDKLPLSSVDVVPRINIPQNNALFEEGKTLEESFDTNQSINNSLVITKVDNTPTVSAKDYTSNMGVTKSLA